MSQTEMSKPPISAIVAMIHVADIERSRAFYRLLGFEVGNRVPREGPAHWMWLYSRAANDWRRGPNLMLTCISRPVNAKAQEVLFYLYARDLVALRNELLASGVLVSEITYPDYLPNGESQITDPDGYCLMIAQAGDDTP